MCTGEAGVGVVGAALTADVSVFERESVTADGAVAG
jgi:hypothetical protein